ncbi:hypothetical protein, partial [Turicimonas muris]|uniref:hypothetical protein n=1 Tax=Turicimonas muris TaxID=1796652 RepID=UPI0026F3D0BF
KLTNFSFIKEKLTMLIVTFHRNFDSFFISDFLVPFWASVSNGAPLLSKKPFSRPILFSSLMKNFSKGSGF